MKKILVLLTVSIFAMGVAFGQTTYKGKVKHNTEKGAISGVTVSAIDSNGKAVVKVKTDAKGKFKITVPANCTKLEFRKQGLSPRTIALGKKKNLKKIKMQ